MSLALGKEVGFAECQLRHSAKSLTWGPSLAGSLPSVVLDTRQRSRLRHPVAITAAFLCRVLPGTRQTSLPSAREKVIGKEGFADALFAEPSLPSVTLGKAFAECKIAFAVCLEHTAKKLIPVVVGYQLVAENDQLAVFHINPHPNCA